MRIRLNTAYWLEKPQWLFVGGSLIAAVVALVAEGPGQYIGLVLLSVCVVTISAWSLLGKPSLAWTVTIVVATLLILGWTVEEPEPALFQSILITAAVGWRIDRLSHSLVFLLILALVPLLGSLGPNQAQWGWWNWSVGTLFTWSLGRVIRLLEQTLNELRNARTQLIDNAAKNAAREERLRISRDVHDLVGHSLTAMLLNIRAAQRALDTVDVDAQHALADAERVGTRGIADIRAALVDLRGDPASEPHYQEALSCLPDGEAVVRLLEEQEHITVSIHGNIEALHGPLVIVVYRILQECITNILKHAPIDTGVIEMQVKADQVILNSENPLPVNHTSGSTLSKNALGLISMRERVASLGGAFSAGPDNTMWKVQCELPRHGAHCD